MMRSFKRGIVLGIAVVLSLVGLVSQVAAQAGGPGAQAADVVNLQTLLLTLAGAGGGGIVAAFIMENQSWFQKLPSDVKGIVFPLLVIGVPVLAQALLQLLPPQYWPLLESYWTPIAGGLFAWGLGTGAYQGIIKPRQMATVQFKRVLQMRGNSSNPPVTED